MNDSFSLSRPLSLLAVAAAGFAGGAVFFPALLEIAPVMAAGPMLLSGLAGTALYLGFWLFAGSVLARRCGGLGTFISRSGAWFAVSLLPLILYFPYLAYRTRLSGDWAELPPLSPRSTALILTAWSLMLLAALLRLNLGGRHSRFIDWTERHAVKLLAAMIVAWLAIFTPLDILKNQFLHVTTVNSALFIEGLSNIADERGIMFSNMLFGSGASVLAVHANVIMLFLWPLYYLWPDYRMLLVVSNLALALAAVPLYMIARRHFSSAISLLLSAMLLLHPIYTAQPGRSDFSELRFMPLLFLTAFYFFEKKRFWLFSLSTVLLMTIREDMGLIVAFFGVYALVRQRSLRWVLGPAFWGLAWFALMFKVLIPGLSPTETTARAAIRYGHLGNQPSDVVTTLILRPWRLLQAATSTPSHLALIYGLFTSFAFIVPLLSGAVILAVPAVAEALLQEETTFTNFMSLPLVATLMAALILGLGRLDKLYTILSGPKGRRFISSIVILSFFTSTSLFYSWYSPNLYQQRYNGQDVMSALKLVPAGESVMLPEYALLYGGSDRQTRGFHQVEYEKEISGDFVLIEDYVLLDLRIPPDIEEGRYARGIRAVTDIVTTSPEFHLVYSANDIELYARVTSETLRPRQDDAGGTSG